MDFLLYSGDCHERDEGKETDHNSIPSPPPTGRHNGMVTGNEGKRTKRDKVTLEETKVSQKN